MDLESYQKLIGIDSGEIAEFPSAIGREKKLHLIRSGMIELSEDAYGWLEGEPALPGGANRGASLDLPREY